MSQHSSHPLCAGEPKKFVDAIGLDDESIPVTPRILSLSTPGVTNVPANPKSTGAARKEPAAAKASTRTAAQRSMAMGK